MTDSHFGRMALVPGLLWLASACVPAAAAPASPSASVAAQVETAARAQLERQAAGAALVEPRFELKLAGAREPAPCAVPVTVQALDTRMPARMRFTASCPASDGWKYVFLVRAQVSSMVAVTAAPVAAGELLDAQHIVFERRDISSIPDSIGALDAAVGQASRRSLRAGEVLRQAQLAAPALVRRGDAVRMVARREQVEVSTAGEALDSGARDVVVRVRNGSTGQVMRMRVSGAGEVVPLGASNGAKSGAAIIR